MAYQWVWDEKQKKYVKRETAGIAKRQSNAGFEGTSAEYAKTFTPAKIMTVSKPTANSQKTPINWLGALMNPVKTISQAANTISADKTMQKAAFDALMNPWGNVKKIKEKQTDLTDPTKTKAVTDYKTELFADQKKQIEAAKAQESENKPTFWDWANSTKLNPFRAGADAVYSAITKKAPDKSQARSQADAVVSAYKGKGDQTAALRAQLKADENAIDAYIYAQDVQNDPNFENYAKEGTKIDTDVKKALTRDAGQMIKTVGLADDRTFAYMEMLEDEYKTYAALNAKYGKDIGDRYLESVMPELESRAAKRISGAVEGIDNDTAKAVAKWSTTVAGSAKNVGRNFQNLPSALTGSEDVFTPGVLQQTNATLREGMTGAEKVINDVTDSFVNMAPSFAMGMIPGAGPALAAAMTGTQSYSSNYADAIIQGYEPGQAAAYALPSAVSEAAMQYGLSGIAKFGGEKGLAKTVERAIAKVAKTPAAAKVLGRISDMGSEALEEYLQATLDPVLRNIALNENNDINPFTEDKAYAALLGAIMAGGMNVTTDIPESIQMANYGKNLRSALGSRYNGLEQDMITGARELGVPGTEGLQKRLNEGKTLSNYNLGSLTQQNEGAIQKATKEAVLSAPANGTPQQAQMKADIITDSIGKTNTGALDAAMRQTETAQGKTNTDVPIGKINIEYSEKYNADDVRRIRKEGKTYRNIIANIDTKISEFFQKWKNGRKSNQGEKLEKLYLGKTTAEANEDISNILGYDVDGRDFIITNDDIKHIFDHHGDAQTEMNRGNLPIEKETIDMLPEIIAHPDDVRPGDIGRDGRQGIEFEKKLQDGSAIYVQFDNKGRGTLEGRTIYIKKSPTAAVNAPTGTSTYTSETTVPELSTSYIPQKEGDVNRKIEEIPTPTDADAPMDTDTDKMFAEELPAEERPVEEMSEEELAARGLAASADKTSVNTPKQKGKIGEALRETYDLFMRKFVDSAHEITKMGSGPEQAFNAARGATQAADYNIGYGRGKAVQHQTDLFGRGNKGDSLKTIFEPVNAQGEGYANLFQQYMYHQLNADRMELTQRADTKIKELMDARNKLLVEDMARNEYIDATQGRVSYNDLSNDVKQALRLDGDMERLSKATNKPVFGYDITAEESAAAAKELLRQHREFAEHEAKVRKFINNNMENRVQAGLITPEFAAALAEMYPHYVPVHRISADGKTHFYSDDIVIGKAIGRANGGEGIIGNLEDALARQTKSVFINGRQNIAMNTVLDAISKNPELSKKMILSDFESGNKKGMEIQYYRDGRAETVTVTPEIAEAFSSLRGYSEKKIGKIAKAVNDTFKKLVTAWNPAFLIRNPTKDFQDGLIYSKYGMGTFTKNYRKAMKEIKENSEAWQLYQASGGFASSIFENMVESDVETRTKKSKGLKKAIDGISQANMVLEQGPRFSEFLSTLEYYGMDAQNVTQEVVQEALFNANDITCNFGRSGSWGKFINRYAVPFFNPSIQGFDKFVRAFKAGDWKTVAKKATGFFLKSAVVGMIPSVANELLCSLLGDDEDKEAYQRISDYTKNAYYLIPMGNGQYFRLPKGRVAGVLGNLAQGIVRDAMAQGDENKTDWEAYGKSVATNIAPANPIENWIGSGIVGVANNKKWTGADIESKEDAKKPVTERYDETTSEIGKFLSSIGLSNIGLSPKKIDVLIDEGTGVLGDFLLPMTSTQAAQTPLTFGFVQDSNVKNKRSGQVYDLKTQLMQQSYAEGETDIPTQTALALDFVTDAQKGVWDNKDKLREINAQDMTGEEWIKLMLGQSERQQEVSQINKESAEINESILGSYDTFRKNIEKYYKIDETADADTQKAQAQQAYMKAYIDTMGAEAMINDTLTDKQIENYGGAKKNGITADVYAQYMTGAKLADTDAEKAQILVDMGLPDKQAAALYEACIERSNTKEENTIAAAMKNGLSASQFLQMKYDVAPGSESKEKSEETSAGRNATSTIIAAAAGYKLPNYKGSTLDKINSMGVSVEDYAYVDDRIGAYSDKVKYLQDCGFGGTQLNGLVENFVMGDTAHDKMTVAQEEMNIPNDVYIGTYITGYAATGSKAERNAQIKAYVDELPDLTDEQKQALYEWNKVSKGKNGSGGSSGGSSGGGRGRSGGSSKAKKIPDSVWNALISGFKSNKISSANSKASVTSVAAPQDTIMGDTLTQMLTDIDNNPLYTAKQRTMMKQLLRARFQEGGA